MHVAIVSEDENAANSGFTLVELLVVIAIIAVLASLLLPSLSSAKLRTRQVNCLSNLHQLSLTMTLYVGDHGKYTAYENSEYPAGTWMGSLAGQNQEDRTRTCPSTRLQAPTPAGKDLQGSAALGWVRWTTDERNAFAGSYGYNGWLYSDGQVDGDTESIHPGFFFRADSFLQYPALTPVFFDENWVDTWPLETDLHSSDLYAGASFYSHRDEIGRCTIIRHGARVPSGKTSIAAGKPLWGAINVAMADGHGELSRLSDLWRLYWHVNWQPPASRP